MPQIADRQVGGRHIGDERAPAYAAYVTALDSEERAASAYQRLAEQAAG